MTQSQTEEKLPLHALFQINDEERTALPPVVRACLRVAQRAHAKDSPRKKDTIDMDYVHHPIAAMHLLRAAGVKDEVTLGTALLHDALEQGAFAFENKPVRAFSRYKTLSDSSKAKLSHMVQLTRASDKLEAVLAKEIAQEIRQENPDIVETKAEYIAARSAELIMLVVRQLTNDPIIDQSEHKRFLQVNKAYQYTPRAQRVKMADLCASFLDDALYGTTMKEANVFYNRAMTICDMCKDVRPALFEMTYRLATLNMDIVEGKASRPDVETFRLNWCKTPKLLVIAKPNARAKNKN